MTSSTRFATVGLALLIGLSACSGGTESPASAPAAGTTTAAGPATAAAPTSAAKQAPQPGTAVDAAQLSASLIDAAKTVKSSHVAMTIAGTMSMTMEGDMDTSDAANPKVSLTLASAAGSAAPGQMKIIVVDKVGYTSLDGGATWQKSTTGLDNITDVLQQQDQSLQSVTKAVYEGEDTVNSAKARHYAMTIKLPASAGGTEVPYDVWVNAKDQIVRTTMDMSTAAAKINYDITISRINEPVSISAPPADKVKG